ncbi:DUF4491 family protein [Haloimpatiens sp. FM7315]|uniref:DUF4491 family protein n=1 Tax=Haloimpatiens sp. FM7315 TaxID=3298609 RepID=UPI0039776FC3
MYFFIAFGILSLLVSLNFNNITFSTLFGILFFCCFWSIKAVLEQEERVLQGRFPKNPKRIYKKQ